MLEEQADEVIRHLERIGDGLCTGAERDSKGIEHANMADGLFAIARALDRLAAAVEKLGPGPA
jgi:hypothetical protein